MNYPRSYHVALNALIHTGIWHNQTTTRNKIARALKDLRKTHGHKRARQERQHMLFICGMFPNRKGSVS